MKKQGGNQLYFIKKSILFSILIIFSASLTPLIAVDVDEDIIQKAQACLGTPYVYGGVSRSGFDCSGFVYYIFRDIFSGWPRVAREQARQGAAVDKDELKPGDLTFWATGSDPNRISHVSIYLGNNSMIHALSEGSHRGIAISSMTSRYWKPKYLFSRRIFSSGTSGNAGSPDIIERIFSRGKYVGELQNDKPNGHGIYYLNNGDVYEGDFQNGLYHGNGKYVSTDGNTWEGVFVAGKLHGQAVRIWPSGSRYEGDYENGLESGGWFRSAETGKVRWILRNRTGEWEVFENTSQDTSVLDTVPALGGAAENNSLNYLFEENPWDAREGVADIPADWERGPLFEEAYLLEQERFENNRDSEKEAFEQYKQNN